jgi:DNA (cytosine-5)-methyltransferase 1
MVKDISNALDSNYHKGIGCGQSRPAVAEIHPELRIRKFSVRECARLQAFPDTYKFPVSNMQAYKQLGNAVTVTVGQAVAESILDFFITNELNSVDDK